MKLNKKIFIVILFLLLLATPSRSEVIIYASHQDLIIDFSLVTEKPAQVRSLAASMLFSNGISLYLCNLYLDKFRHSRRVDTEKLRGYQKSYDTIVKIDFIVGFLFLGLDEQFNKVDNLKIGLDEFYRPTITFIYKF